MRRSRHRCVGNVSWHVVSRGCHLLLRLFPGCVGEAHSAHSSTNCLLAQMVAAERAVIALTASDGRLSLCFTFVNAPPTLLPFNKGFGIESLSDSVHFVTKAGYLQRTAGTPSRGVGGWQASPLEHGRAPGEEVLKAWRDRHHIELEMHMAPPDTLVSRFYREYRRGTPSLVQVEKARSIFRAASVVR